MNTMIGRTVSHYRIIEKLGGGGMGIVYKAEDTSLKRIVALKFLPPEMTRDPEAKRRFVAEAQAASSIDHPNICTVHEIDETDDGQMFICMSYYPGESLKKRVKDGQIPVQEAVRICVQAGMGLAKAHAKGIVHRDIKPANIMLTEEGQVKIVDFGLAKLAGQSRLTRSGTTMGTIAYMSPEQARGESVDARSDIWSLGIVLFELLTGSLPFKGDHEQALVYSILNADPLRASDLRRDVPLELEKVVEKSMEKGHGERYQNMYELVKDLEEVGRKIEAGEARKRFFRFRLKKRTRRFLQVVVPICVVMAAVLGIFLWRWSAARVRPATIVVFTFTNKDASMDFFTDGLRDLLVMELTKVSRLRVKSADGAMDTGKSLPEIAKQLGADYVLSGTVATAGDKVRVTWFLEDGRTNEQVVSDNYEKSRADVSAMAVQAEITRAVVTNIRIEVTPEEKALLESAVAVKPAAYEAYLKGVFYAKKMTVENERKGMEYFTAAIAKDPSYAPSYVGLASAWLALGSSELGVVAPAEAAQKAEEAALKALALNKLLGEPHRVLGQIKRDFSWDFAAANAEFTAALERNPSDAETLVQIALLRIVQGTYDDARQSAVEAQKADPLFLWFSTVASFASACQAQWQTAETELQKALDFNSAFAPGYAERGRLLMMRGQHAEAAAALEKAMSLMEEFNPIIKARLAYAQARSGNAPAARAALNELTAKAKSSYIPPAAFAMIHAGLGDAGKAFQWLQKAFEEKAPQLVFLAVNPEWADLRADPRFAELVGKVGAGK